MKTPKTVHYTEHIIPAPLLRRAAAYLIDIIVVLLILRVFVQRFTLTISYSPTVGWEFGFLNAHLQILISFLYFSFFEFFFGQTIGKKLLSIRTISTNGKNANRLQLFLRNSMKSLEIPFFLSLPCILYTKKGQSVGDLIAKTIVVYTKYGEKKTQSERFWEVKKAIASLMMFFCLFSFGGFLFHLPDMIKTWEISREIYMQIVHSSEESQQRMLYENAHSSIREEQSFNEFTDSLSENMDSTESLPDSLDNVTFYKWRFIENQALITGSIDSDSGILLLLKKEDGQWKFTSFAQFANK